MKYLPLKKTRYLLRNCLVSLTILAMLALTFTSCSDLFDVENPNSLVEDKLDNPGLIPALSNSAQGALSQVYDTAVLSSGMVADGVIAFQTENSGSRFADEGLLEGDHGFWGDLWNDLAAARWTATEVTSRLEQMVDNPNSDLRVAKSYFWDAIARITLADLFRKIPFDNGPPNTPTEVYEGTIPRLEKAIQIAEAAPNSPEKTKYLAAAYATVARVYRSLYFERGGDMSAFAKAAQNAQRALDVGPDFRLDIIYQTPGSTNSVYTNLNIGNFYAMDDGYSNIHDPVSGQLDPRIQHGPFRGLGSLGGDSLFSQLKYPSRNAEIPVSRWQEAELIIAEYALLQNNLSKAVNRINRVRDAAELESFSSNDPQRIQQQIIYERKAEFWLELRRWQDMRYYNIIPERWVPLAAENGIDRRFRLSLREIDANPNV